VNVLFLLPFAAGGFSLLLAFLSLFRRKPSPAGWCFFAGMVALGLDSLFTGLNLRATQLGQAVDWLIPAFIAKSFVPVAWLCFSLTYSRSNYPDFLRRWTVPLALLGLLPIGVSFGLLDRLWSPAAVPGDFWWLQAGLMAQALNVGLLITLILILTNLEQTFRSAVGTMRWRIKFTVMALAVIFGARLYVRSQAILFFAPDIALWSVESGGLLLGCVLLAIAYARTRLAESDVYPSLTVLRSSLTVLIVGAYLFVVGVLAQVVSRFGGAEIFQFQAFVVLLGATGLAVLLLSDRARQQIHVFVVRHFKKAQHDSVRIWTLVSRRLASVSDQAALCAVSAKLISETFDVLSVAVWLLDAEKGRLVAGASTGRRGPDASGLRPMDAVSGDVADWLRARSSPFNLEDADEPWAEELRRLNPAAFSKGGHRLCIPLRAGEQGLGVIVLGDRVSAAVYTVEELELLKCIGDQVASVLLNLQLANELSRTKELEAFQTMSAFFVHDLKNAAASLNLMLKNLPVHFDDPAFRQDALRGIGNTARRIDEMIARLSALRQQRPGSLRVKADLNQLVTEVLDGINGTPNIEVLRELPPLPSIRADREQIQSVVTNLVLNARDAVGHGGRIQVRTELQAARVVLSVIDNGCGMSQAFVNDSLFRPFQSTKKKGLGIGLFQSRAIVHAHGGGIQVETAVGKGTTFLVSLPVNGEP
jgi:putative PEP-CTERM system histidine kinase